MRKLWMGIIGTVLGFLANLPLEAGEFWNPMFNAEVTAGYRQDNFSWAMSGLHNFPNELWRMNWKGIQIFEVTSQLSYTSCNNYYIRANGGWGTIGGASVTARGRGTNIRDTSFTSSSDSSDSSSSHHNPFSRIHGNSKDGSVWDGSACVGYQWMSNYRRFIFTPVIGYSYHALNYQMSDARQVFNSVDFPVLLGPIHGLHVNYHPRIQGPFVGFDINTILEMPCVLLFGTVEFHWDKYRANGRWNLHDNFVNSWHDSTSGKGLWVNLGFNYRFGCNWYLGVIGSYRNWHGRKGRHVTRSLKNNLEDPDQVFGTMPAFPPGEHTHLKRIQWNSWSVAATLDFRFWED